ncbi:muscle, skeletal receptor tyrosine-protein kinase, partial [Caerostris darwini]
PAKLKGGRSIYNVSWGSNVRLECSAQGEPPPVITWFQDGEPVSVIQHLIWLKISSNPSLSCAYRETKH